MNESEKIAKIEEGVPFIMQDVDELLDEKFQSGEINTEQYLNVNQHVRAFADESRNIIASIQIQQTHGNSNANT